MQQIKQFHRVSVSHVAQQKPFWTLFLTTDLDQMKINSTRPSTSVNKKLNRSYKSGLMPKTVMVKSQVPILHKNFKSFILKSQIPWAKSKSQMQAPNPNLKTQNPNQIPVFPQLHKHEL